MAKFIFNFARLVLSFTLLLVLLAHLPLEMAVAISLILAVLTAAAIGILTWIL